MFDPAGRKPSDHSSLDEALQLELSRAVIQPSGEVARAIAETLKKLDKLDSIDPRIRRTLQALRDRVAPFYEVSDELGPEVRVKRFQDKYKIEVLGDNKVSVDLGKTTRIDFLYEAQALLGGLWNFYTYVPLTPINRDCLIQWKTWSQFMSAPQKPLKIDCCVSLSNNLKLSEQIARGWSNVAFEDLVVAHTAGLVVSGESPFRGFIVRAREGAGVFEPPRRSGLLLVKPKPRRRHPEIFASCDLS